ncbi:bifunctional aspartate kinase/homoserine dehydrogenase I, partial [Candidatus Gracilibacteria bacterium]|nr:bifunctional aspartate kinase/homoserine dehydrogenase I [Candidatus Gracilibacteria bacterium]
MKIMKFGGTSVGSPERIKEVIAIVKMALKKGKVAVVVSAFTKITDDLIEMAQRAAKGDESYAELYQSLHKRHVQTVDDLVSSKNTKRVMGQVVVMLNELKDVLTGIYLLKECSPQALDYVCSFGERLCAYITAQAFVDRGVKAEYLDARSVVRTDDNFTSAKVHFSETNKLISVHFKNHAALQVVTGFVGSTSQGQTTTLGRGGSDYSASIFGAALKVRAIEIWTDVDGVLTADPRVVKNAFCLDSLTYEEAMEMSHFGAKVIYPPTMQPAMDKGVPIVIKNTFNPSAKGTVISHKRDPHYPHAVKGISSIKSIALLRIEGSGLIGIAGISARMFSALARKKVNVILISQASSEHSICVAIEPKQMAVACAALEEEFIFELKSKQIESISADSQLACLAVVGEQMRHRSGVSAALFNALGKAKINVAAIAQGSSERIISVIISTQDEAAAVRAVHDAFFGVPSKKAEVWLAGVGVVGSALLEQISSLKDPPFVLAGVCTSRKITVEKSTIVMKNPQEVMEKYLSEMYASTASRKIFVDCTAGDDWAKIYPSLLEKGISIVTPNKKANSASIKHYESIRSAAKKGGVFFLYETNVGAGLPIISTLHDLLVTGDEVVRIDAILSGTLSYIFNSFDATIPFSELVKSAKEKGYTDPDPRDDLSGMDVARKLLVLCREMGMKMELEDLRVENLVPIEARKAKNVETFFVVMKKFDAEWKARLEAAKKKG